MNVRTGDGLMTDEFFVDLMILDIYPAFLEGIKPCVKSGSVSVSLPLRSVILV